MYVGLFDWSDMRIVDAGVCFRGIDGEHDGEEARQGGFLEEPPAVHLGVFLPTLLGDATRRLPTL